MFQTCCSVFKRNSTTLCLNLSTFYLWKNSRSLLWFRHFLFCTKIDSVFFAFANFQDIPLECFIERNYLSQCILKNERSCTFFRYVHLTSEYQQWPKNKTKNTIITTKNGFCIHLKRNVVNEVICYDRWNQLFPAIWKENCASFSTFQNQEQCCCLLTRYLFMQISYVSIMFAHLHHHFEVCGAPLIKF